MRLITRKDTSLAIALIASAVILFQQPLRYVFDVARDMESRYHIDLIPALMLLVAVFVFHEFQKRSQAKSEARTSASEAALAKARSEELEHLMAFGQGLANALDQRNLQQTLWKFLPTFAHSRPFWVVAYRGKRWELLVHDGRSIDALEPIAARVISPDPFGPALDEQAELYLPLIAGGVPVGVIGVGNLPAMSAQERNAWGAVAALIAIGVRNMQLFAETRELSLRDALTGCFNRAHGVETLDSEIRRSRRTGRPVSVLMFDIDHFKMINDRLGHLRGDELLQRVGASLTRILRSTDLRCRYGGDEFMVVLPDTPGIGAEQVAESIRRELGSIAVSSGDISMPVTISVGVAVSSTNDRNPEMLIERADKALYDSKRSGRNRVSTAPTAAGLSLVKAQEALARTS